MTETQGNGNQIAIAHITTLLQDAQNDLEKFEGEYHRLRAQVFRYQEILRNLTALEEGDFAIPGDGAPLPARRLANAQLKDAVYEYFKAKPRMTQSPRAVADHLVQQGWADDGLRLRVSNLLRKIVEEEAWLARPSHGKYQFVSTVETR